MYFDKKIYLWLIVHAYGNFLDTAMHTLGDAYDSAATRYRFGLANNAKQLWDIIPVVQSLFEVGFKATSQAQRTDNESYLLSINESDKAEGDDYKIQFFRPGCSLCCGAHGMLDCPDREKIPGLVELPEMTRDKKKVSVRYCKRIDRTKEASQKRLCNSTLNISLHGYNVSALLWPSSLLSIDGSIRMKPTRQAVNNVVLACLSTLRTRANRFNDEKIPTITISSSDDDDDE